MTYPLLSPSIHSVNYNSSNLSPLTSRPIDYIVPTGTVASRIILLQNLATPSAPNVPRPLISRRRENSRIGFGRRVSGRFGKPASRISVPLEQPEILPEHSFLGHRTSRANHAEAHAYAHQKAKWKRTTGLLSEVKPEGVGTRVQCDATSPWGVASKRQPDKNPQLVYSDLNKDRRSSTNSISYSKLGSNVADLRAPPACDRDEEPPPQRQDGKIANNAPDSRSLTTKQLEDQISIETTSSIRRRSVNELYKQYGIQRPLGLASSENLAYESDGTCQSQRKHRLCHVCLWVNGTESRCLRCGHLFCHSCDNPSPGPVTQTVESSQHRGDILNGKVLSQGSAKNQLAFSQTNLSNERSKRTDLEISITPQPLSRKRESPENYLTKAVRTPSNPETLHSFKVEQVAPGQGLSKIPLTHIGIASPSAAPLQLQFVPKRKTGYKLNQVIENSPFLVADRLSQSHLLRTLPAPTKIADRSVPRHPSQRTNYRNQSPNQANSSTGGPELIREFHCESPSCRATHAGHRPYRHSVSCSRSMRCNPNDPHSATGDEDEHCTTSQHKTNQSQPKNPAYRHQHMYEWAYHSDHGISPPSKVLSARNHHGHSQARAEAVCSAQYVEIHGYPGTGQTHHDSPTASFVNWNCQDCLNEKKFKRRPSTHHHFRCHVHNDRREELHQIVASGKIDTTTLSPLLTHKPIQEQRKPEWSENSSDNVVMPTPRRKITSPSWMTDDTFEIADEGGPKQKAYGNLTEIAPLPKLKSNLPRESNMQSTSRPQHSVKEMPDAVSRKELTPRPMGEGLLPEQERRLRQTPSRSRTSTLARLKAKWELESAAALREKSMKGALNSQIEPWRRPKMLTEAPPPFAEIEPGPLKRSIVESHPEEDQSVDSELSKSRPAYHGSWNYNKETSTRLPKPSNPPTLFFPPSPLPLQTSGSVRRLSAIFNYQGKDVISPVRTMSQQQQQDEMQKIQATRRNNLKERVEMGGQEVAREEKDFLNKKLEKQHDEIQKTQIIRRKSLQERADRKEEEKWRKHRKDASTTKATKTRLSSFPIQDADTLEPINDNDARMLSANQLKHTTTAGDSVEVTDDPQEKCDSATGTDYYADQAEARFSPMRSTSNSDASHHEPVWKEVTCAGYQLKSDTNVEDTENESFEFGDVGIKGISIIIHLEGSEDLVIKTDLSGV